MSNSNVTIFNGTFRKLNGEKRTMRFIRKADLPASMVNEATISNLEGKTHNEVVYDVDGLNGAVAAYKVAYEPKQLRLYRALTDDPPEYIGQQNKYWGQ